MSNIFEQEKFALTRTGSLPANVPSGSMLLKTKLQIPKPNPDHLLRAALLAQLDEGHSVTVIAAPPGSGKTALLAAWIARQRHPCAWLKLDELDNDLQRFLMYLLAAMKVTVADPTVPEQALEAVLGRLTMLPLIIDDYHLISNAAIHEALSFLIAHLEPESRVMIAGRTQPALPLARLRASGRLLEIIDLTLSLEETAVLIGRAPDDDAVAVCLERTAGWLAGVQLAALWLQSGADAQQFGGRYRHVFDYFNEEVFAHQTSAIQAFLLQTALLDELTAPACNALTGRKDGQTLLERLEQLNLFIAPLDDLRQSYRYHPLFADFLRAALNKQPDSREHHLRAVAWYEQIGSFSAAVACALACEAYERAADLIEMHAAQGRDVTDWLDHLPPELIHERSGLIALRDAQYASSMVEPLSDREVEVLTLISTGLSNPEIAKRLIIAVSTVKSHVKNIYRKLNVDTRYEAMQRARELDLRRIQLESDYRRLIK